jgi:hypothetical protein
VESIRLRNFFPLRCSLLPHFTQLRNLQIICPFLYPSNEVDYIARIPTLTHLELSFRPFFTDTVRKLSTLTNLVSFTFDKIHGNFLPLITNFKKLQQLKLAEAECGDADLPYLTNFPALTKLEFEFNWNVSANGLRVLKALSNLRSLTVSRCGAVNNLVFLRSLTSLTHLHLNYCCLQGTDLRELRLLTDLRAFSFVPRPIDRFSFWPEHLSHILPLTRLSYVALEEYIIPDGIEYLCQLPWLQVLGVAGVAGMDEVKAVPLNSLMCLTRLTALHSITFPEWLLGSNQNMTIHPTALFKLIGERQGKSAGPYEQKWWIRDLYLDATRHVSRAALTHGRI